MLSHKAKKLIKLYSATERSSAKARRRRGDAAEAAAGKATVVQERNRALPHASQMVLSVPERELPSE